MMSRTDEPLRCTVVGVGRDHLEVTNPDGRRFTFPIAELQATRRPPRLDNRARDLLVNSPLRLIEEARHAAEEHAILNDLI